MRIPSFERLQREAENRETGVTHQGHALHPNPKLYKYYHHLFTLDAEVEGRDFLCEANRLCTYEYQRQVETLGQQEKPGWGYTLVRLPRRGDDAPFDESHPRWSSAEWAPPLDDDPDPSIPSGHR